MQLHARLLSSLAVLLGSGLAFAASATTSTTTTTVKPSSSGAPQCSRPRDFSNSKAIGEFGECLRRLDHYCDTHVKERVCLAHEEAKNAKLAALSSKDAKPKDRCWIEHDGSYVCRQDPIRFLAVGQDMAVPGGAAAPAAGASPGGAAPSPASGAPTSGAPNSGALQPAPPGVPVPGAMVPAPPDSGFQEVTPPTPGK